MGVDVVDVQNGGRRIHASWWQWRPTAELIRRLELFDEMRLEQLCDGFGELSADEAHQLADGLECRFLSVMQSGQRILLDGTVDRDSDDGTFYREPEDQHRNY